MDGFLDFLGLYRSDVAKDATCLFRAVSEQLFHTQIHHEDLKEKCIEYMRRHKDVFEPLVDDFDDYLVQLEHFEVWAGPMEMNALSLKYRIDFKVYTEAGKSPIEVTNINSDKTIVLAGFGGNRYDCVYTKSYLSASAVCQSITYQILYKCVFGLGDDVDIAVEKMLHDKTYSKQRKNLNQCFKSCTLEDGNENEYQKEQDPSQEIKKALEQGVPPFPYKVAKALDPNIYRNVEFDIWNERKKETLKSEQYVTPSLAPGVKCKVYFEQDGIKSRLTGHVQEIHKDAVTVYIEEICQRCTVTEKEIEVLPIPQYKALTWQGGKTYRVYNNCFRHEADKKVKKKSVKRNQELGTHRSSESCSSPGFIENMQDVPRTRSFSSVSRYRTPPREKYNFSNQNTPSSNFKKSLNRRTGQAYGTYNQAQNSSYGGSLTPCQSPPGIPPPVPSQVNSEKDVPCLMSSVYENSTEFSSEMTIQSVLAQEYSIREPFASPPMTSDVHNYLQSPEVVYHAPGAATSTPLQIPQASYGHHIDEATTLPLSPNTPTMTLLPYPTYYMYPERGMHVLPFCSGPDVNSGIPSMYLNTPPSGMTPPHIATTWYTNYGNITSPNYNIPQTVQPSYLACTPPLVGDISSVSSPVLSSGWSTPQPNYLVQAPAQIAYQYQSSLVPVPDAAGI